MKESHQDRYYLEVEADAFFQRNSADLDPAELRPKKRSIDAEIEECGITPARVVEFGCNYGDLLAHWAKRHGAECWGVEPSGQAVDRGTRAYGDAVRLLQGTIADNAISAGGEHGGYFDLVVIDDVFCWVSRETLFQSVANVDDLVADGGFLFIREFLPLRSKRNPNHHVADGTVYCYKPAGPHHAMFTASGTYAVVWQKVWIDHADPWITSGGREMFESRWVDTIMRKSLADYYE